MLKSKVTRTLQNHLGSRLTTKVVRVKLKLIIFNKLHNFLKIYFRDCLIFYIAYGLKSKLNPINL